MATPTPMKHAPSQQGRTPSATAQGRTPSQLAAATPPVSTPFSNAAQAAFSPRGQRSPQHVKKSPATSGLLGQPNMGALNFDSPSTAAAMGALGMGNGFDVGLDGMGGLETLTAAFASEDEKLRRLDAILKMLNEKKGFVSDAGIERLAQRLGMELLSEEQTTPDGRKTKTLTIAGSAVAMDIVLENNIVLSATLSYHGNASSVAPYIEEASDILLRDLQLKKDQSPLTKTLNDFAANFERLALLDKLSIVPGLDCHEALVGIFSSLERLHGWDIEQAKRAPDNAGKPDPVIDSLVMCQKNGKPVMNARGRVGLALQYWKHRRFSTRPARKDENYGRIWSMLLGCAAIDGIGLPPVRVSKDWISSDIISKQEATGADGQPQNVLDWQEPDNVSLPLSEENKDAGMELLQADLSTTRVPRVMFTATFGPPLILPQNDWARLYAFAGVEPPPTTADFGQAPPTFDALFFPLPSGAKQDPSEARTISQTANVNTYDEQGNLIPRTHRNSLYIYKPIYSQEVTEMPFAHPRQLIDMLPLLRQYAFLSTLLQTSFKNDGDAIKPSKESKDATVSSKTTTVKDQLADFLAGNAADDGHKQDMDLDVILWVHPAPHMQVVFPMGSSTANISFRILGGGTVEITAENILDANGQGRKKTITREILATALERLENLGEWAEWIRTRVV